MNTYLQKYLSLKDNFATENYDIAEKCHAHYVNIVIPSRPQLFRPARS